VWSPPTLQESCGLVGSRNNNNNKLKKKHYFADFSFSFFGVLEFLSGH
jgi:hypothetical protein